MEDSLLPRNAWGGAVEPEKIAASIAEKCNVDLETAKAALLHTSKPRGRTRVYYQTYAEEFLDKIKSVPAEASEVHVLLGEGYTTNILVVREALALHPHDLDAARTMLAAGTKN